MSEMSKNGKSACKEVDLANLAKNLTKPEEKVAEPEIPSKCSKMSKVEKVMAATN